MLIVRLIFDASIMKLLRFILTLLLLMHTALTFAGQKNQPVSSIQNVIGNFIGKNFNGTAQYEYNLSPIDPRLRLPLCSEPLQVYSQTGALNPGRNTIGVQCHGDKKWNIYTTAQIKAYMKVLAVSKPIRRGEIITPSHLTLQRQDIATLRRGYLVNADAIVNKQAKHHLAIGAIVNRSDFVEPKIVKRGEKVNIVATSTHFSISMNGIALTDGHKNQRIRVRNVNSKRIIQATVIKPGLVSVY